MSRISSWLALGAVALLATACDRTNPDDFEADAAETPIDASISDASVPDALDDTSDGNATADGFLADGGGRCPGSTYTSAPDGGACDPRRIQYVSGRGGRNQCFAPPNGTFCDVFQLSVFQLETGSLPPGFVCGSAELGVTTCRYALTDGGSKGALDDAAIAAACAVTSALPQTAVTCIVYD